MHFSILKNILYGCYCSDVEEEIIQLDTAHGELNRIDRVVLRYDKFERNIKTVVIKGTPALNPTPPASLKTKNQFDLVLADVRVDKAITEIKQINDMRDSDLCGYLGGKVLEKNVSGAIQSLGTNGYRVFPGGLKIVKGFYKTPDTGGSDGVKNGVYYKIISNLKLPITFDDMNSIQVFATSTTAWTWANGVSTSGNGISLIVSNISSAQVNSNTGISYFVIGN